MTLLIALALAVSFVGTAAAKKGGGKPSPDPVVYYEVKMELVNSSDGLSTDGDYTPTGEPGICTAGRALIMRLEDSRSGSLLATADGSFPSDLEPSEPNLYLKADSFGDGFATGCYHGTNPSSTESNADFFRMVFDRDGALEKITWHFDVQMDGTTVTHKYALTSQNKKGRNSVGVEWAGNLAGGSTTDDVTGSFELWDYTNTDGPVWELIGTRQLKFTLTISPHSEDE